ncbi:MAG: CRISPR-associated protein Cas4, partial [Gemmataceae bacterium]|nr:CRISPR-associated protein Cas4 [Gemmataceae bacterium]
MIPLPLLETAQRPMRVMALRALGYCHRLFYLEEVERIHVANLEVLEGRELHATHFPVDEEGPTTTLELASERLGLVGRADCLQRHDGSLIPYELKRGRPYYNDQNQPMPWPGDRLQVIAYALLLEEVTGQPVPEARIRYHGANVTVRIPIDEAARADFQTALDLAHRLQQLPHRPPVADNPKLCEKCSLAPVCLPEEVRLQQNDDHQPLRLFPPEPHGTTLHV